MMWTCFLGLKDTNSLAVVLEAQQHIPNLKISKTWMNILGQI